MQKLKKIHIVLSIVIFFPKILFSNIIDEKDVKLLGLKDRKYFLENCFIDKKYKETSKCINFLGLKIYLNLIENNMLDNKKSVKVETRSIFYLNKAAENGSKNALINLGWIYSNENSSFYNLKKSAQYFNLSKVNKIETTNYNKKNYSLSVNNKTSNNRSYITLAMSLMKKIDLYKRKSLDNKILYLTVMEYEKAEKAIAKILEISKISEEELNVLRNKINEDNNIIFSFLDKDLDNYKEKYRVDALRNLKQLLSIYNKLY